MFVTDSSVEKLPVVNHAETTNIDLLPSDDARLI